MNEETQRREREAAKRIASLIRSIGRGPRKPTTAQEQQTLKAAAGRLDQMLKAAAAADREALKNAALRLDQLLVDINKGKDVTSRIKRGQREELKP